MTVPFAQHQNFLDPVLTSEGKPYGPQRYREIIKERYYISKYTNSSYIDIGDINPTERRVLLEYIVEELQQQKDMIDKQKRK